MKSKLLDDFLEVCSADLEFQAMIKYLAQSSHAQFIVSMIYECMIKDQPEIVHILLSIFNLILTLENHDDTMVLQNFNLVKSLYLNHSDDDFIVPFSFLLSIQNQLEDMVHQRRSTSHGGKEDSLRNVFMEGDDLLFDAFLGISISDEVDVAI
jgi:hypothetical protein